MRFTRREILKTFLGAPFAMAACQELSAPRRFPEGEIVGQNATLGHILREGRSFEVPADNWKTVKLAIVGGELQAYRLRGSYPSQALTISCCSSLRKTLAGRRCQETANR
jgi:hypothetical protein